MPILTVCAAAGDSGPPAIARPRIAAAQCQCLMAVRSRMTVPSLLPPPCPEHSRNERCGRQCYDPGVVGGIKPPVLNPRGEADDRHSRPAEADHSRSGRVLSLPCAVQL